MLIFSMMLPLAAEDTISFSGSSSSLSLQEGRRHVSLTGGAVVTVGSLTIEAETIELDGDNYERVSCTGSVHVTDSDRGLEIRTSNLVYDRSAERIMISSWCEVSDSTNELVASASALFYDMAAEVLEMQMNVRLVKNTSDGILSAQAEYVSYDRSSSTLVLSGGAQVDWKGDSYHASLIGLDLEEETVSLSGQIGGSIHG